MNDLKERMREWWEYDPGHLIPQAATRIEALEAQVRAADALADAAGELSLSKYGLKSCRVRTALAAYRATKEGGA